MKRSFVTRLLIPALAAAGLIATVAVVASGDRAYPVQAPAAAPATTPYPQTLAGAGIIEAASRNLALAMPLPGIIAKVLVQPGEIVPAGAPLLQLDAKAVAGELALRRAAVKSAEARVMEAKAQRTEADDLLAKITALSDPRAVSAEEVVRRQQAAAGAQARHQLALASVAEAQAAVARVQIDLDRLTLRAPIAGEVLQVNARVGEHVAPGDALAPIVLGDTATLHVRVDIDETEASRFTPGAQAVAHLRGDGAAKMPLTFVRTEPLVVPKKSLTGGSAERVDTRVLQALFAFRPGALPVYVGQQVDVFIDARSKS